MHSCSRGLCALHAGRLAALIAAGLLLVACGLKVRATSGPLDGIARDAAEQAGSIVDELGCRWRLARDLGPISDSPTVGWLAGAPDTAEIYVCRFEIVSYRDGLGTALEIDVLVPLGIPGAPEAAIVNAA